MKRFLLSLAIFFVIPLTAMQLEHLSSSEIQTLEQWVIQRFKLTTDKCHISVSKKRVLQRLGPGGELACIFVGYKNVHFDDLIENSPTVPNNFKQIFKVKNIKFMRLVFPKPPSKYYIKKPGEMVHIRIVYSPKGEQYGLLLAKLFLENALAKHQKTSHQYDSAYLLGKLLEYPEKDLKYYYVIKEFRGHYFDRHKTVFPERTGSFPRWPQEIKDEYIHFEKNIWKSDDFEDDKEKATQWLNMNKKFTNQQLKEQIAKLSAKLNTYKD